MDSAITVRTIEWGSVEGDRARAIRMTVFVEEQRAPVDEELDAIDEWATHWLAVDSESGAALGTGRFFEVDPAPDGGRVGRIGRMAVSRAARGRGVGSALIRAIIESARAEGFARLELDSQTHAIPFYETHGFQACGPEHMDAGIPHRLMQRALV